jgi:hypothetical protein
VPVRDGSGGASALRAVEPHVAGEPGVPERDRAGERGLMEQGAPADVDVVESATVGERRETERRVV